MTAPQPEPNRALGVLFAILCLALIVLGVLLAIKNGTQP